MNGNVAQGAPQAPPQAEYRGQPGGNAQPEVTEEVEGVLHFEGRGNGYLRDPKKNYNPQPFDVE
ncbi:MAG: transcription termination factor Rho, partial [Anaeromyxobacter sp.]|nr:transcription termination factor Rho [Anaeromyxobacter sp.]